jgi:eukaryotic-like serine/threonine-protein kinase
VTVLVAEHQRAGRPERIGRYKVVDRIGRGAMGVVYSAHDELMGRDVAVKVMMTDLEGEPDIRARFMREAQVSAKLAHRNIVTIFDIGEDNGRLFIVMELLKGDTLDRALKQRSFSIEEKVDLTLEVCEGLAVASGAGVCHRDVKPGNLFVQADGGLKILDFGIARLASSSMTASGFIVGTPDYMSPEQARGVAVDERSDIFSVGAVLYLMLTGRKPFVAPDLPAVLHKVVSEDPPPIEAKDAPPALARIVFKALSKDAAARFQKFPEFSAELSRWRRRYDAETRALAERVAMSLESLRDFASEEVAEAEALGVEPEADLQVRLSEIAAGYPQLLASGADGLRSGEWLRRDIEEIDGRIGPIVAAWEQRIAELRGAAADLAAGKSSLENGDARSALDSFENVLRRVPSAAVQQLIDRARGVAADQQARDDRVRSLLAEAADARAHGRLDAALALSNQALLIHPDHAEARQVSGRLRQELAAAEAEKARNCERFLERARSALQLEDLDEAERQMQLAVQTGSSNPEIAIVRTALGEARTAREKADAQVEEVRSQLALARNEFQIGERTLAIKRLELLAVRHPSSTALQVELERLRTEHAKLGAAEQTQSDADRLATEAAAALEKGDAQTATRLAEEALARMPSHEGALRTSAVAHARLREEADRSARQHRAAELIETAKSLLARGKVDRAIKEARRAADLDPLGDAHAVISEALRRQASDAAREASEQEAARRATEARALLEHAATALRDKDFPRARGLAERALALEPDNMAPKKLIAKIATAAALSVTTLDDDTVNVAGGQPDPDATAVLEPVADGWVARTVSRVRLLFQSRPAKTVNQVAAGRDTNRKEA